MSRLKLRCAEKINLSLDVTGKRPDGYHNIESIFQSVSIYDELELTVTEGEGISLTCSGNDEVPCDERNIAWKAAQAMLDASGRQAKIAIHIDKHIPSGAGMGGGSADAAGVLSGLNKLLGCDLSLQTLCEMGAKLGADVPFILVGGSALVFGIGEVIKPVKPMDEEICLLILKGTEGISTPAAYKAIDSLEKPPHPDTFAVLRAVETKNRALLCESCGNLFDLVTQCADVERAKARALELGAECAVMTGSGAAVFAVMPKVPDEQIMAKLREEFAFAAIAYPVRCSIEAISAS